MSAIISLNQQPTAQTDIDSAIADLRRGAQRLACLSLSERLQLINECIPAVCQTGTEWVEAACRAKRIEVGTPASAEEVLAGPLGVLRYLRLVQATFQDIHRHGKPRLPGRPRMEHGQVRVPVFPTHILCDRLLFFSMKAESWLQPEVEEHDVFGQAADLTGGGTPTVVAVLGAGNVASIPATDSLTKIFQDSCAVLLKMNPINDYLGPSFERAFASLIKADLLRLVYGGADTGQYAIEHESVDAVHITGSNLTHDAIVWGSTPGERQQRMDRNQPLLNKPITSELGNVTPWIVVPGRYSKSQLRAQAENLVASITNNASFNCIATKMLITWREWPDREPFLDLVEHVLATIPSRYAYYPGATDRFSRFNEAPPSNPTTGHLPWTIRRNTRPDESPHLYQQESFVCVCGETALSAASPDDFLDQSVDFVNDRLWGTLAAALTVPRQLPPERLDSALRRLRYGTIGVNQWPGVAFGLMSPSWGGFPGSDLCDVQSGIGSVHNTFLLNRPEKTILKSPLKMFPKPMWFSTHRHPQSVAWKLLEFYEEPTRSRLPPLLLHAIRG